MALPSLVGTGVLDREKAGPLSVEPAVERLSFGDQFPPLGEFENEARQNRDHAQNEKESGHDNDAGPGGRRHEEFPTEEPAREDQAHGRHEETGLR